MESSGARARHVARLSGLRDAGMPTLEAVERRRLQLWGVMSALLLGVSLLVALGTLWPDLRSSGVFDPEVLRFAMVGLTFGFTVYVFEKEHHLRRLTSLLVEERVARARLSSQVRQLHRLLEAGRAVASTLDLEEVLDVVLRNALELFDAASGSILLEEDGQLRVCAVHGLDDVPADQMVIGEAAARAVMATRQPLLATGTALGQASEAPSERSMSVPIVHHDDVVGVLTVNAGDQPDFSQLDLSMLGAFAEHAAAAIVNARRYQSEHATASRFEALESARVEFRSLLG